METSLPKSTSIITFSWRSNQFFSTNCEKIHYLMMLENSVENSRSRARLLPKFNHLFTVYRHISGEIFAKIHQQLYTKLLTHRQKNRQTDKCHIKNNRLGIGNKKNLVSNNDENQIHEIKVNRKYD